MPSIDCARCAARRKYAERIATQWRQLASALGGLAELGEYLAGADLPDERGARVAELRRALEKAVTIELDRLIAENERIEQQLGAEELDA
jgi:hypothetical protein